MAKTDTPDAALPKPVSIVRAGDGEVSSVSVYGKALRTERAHIAFITDGPTSSDVLVLCIHMNDVTVTEPGTDA